MGKNIIKRKIKINKHMFELEIYPRLNGVKDISWEIFAYNYEGCLFAFSNKEKINKIMEERYIFEPKKNNENNNIGATGNR